jgi:hypothetical protein
MFIYSSEISLGFHIMKSNPLWDITPQQAFAVNKKD